MRKIICDICENTINTDKEKFHSSKSIGLDFCIKCSQKFAKIITDTFIKENPGLPLNADPLLDKIINLRHNSDTGLQHKTNIQMVEDLILKAKEISLNECD